MKKTILIVVAAVALVAAVILFTTQGGAQALGLKPKTTAGNQVVPQTPVAAVVAPVVVSNTVNVSGKLVPARYMDVGFQAAGIVKEVLVTEGQAVESGQLLARLGNEEQLKLSVSQAKLDVLNAQKALNDLYINAPLTAAQVTYDITQTQKDLDKAIKTRTAMDYPKATQKQIDDAARDLKAANGVLKEVEGFKDSTNAERRQAYDTVLKNRDMYQSKYNWLISKYTDKEKAEADAAVTLQKTKLEDMKRKLAIYSKGPDPDEVEIAKAKLEIAKDQQAAAESKFQDLELRAPFAGSIVNLNVHVGDMMNAGQAAMLLADFSRWRIESQDLTEMAVTRIHEGAAASISLDALPGKTFSGKVASIKELGETKKGDITYTAVIEIDGSDPLFRWNMTSPITIKTQ